MFRFLSLFTFASLLGGVAFAQDAAAPAAAPVEFKTLEEKVSYLVGMQMGQQLKTPPFKIDLEIVMRGVHDAATGAKPAMSEEQMQAAAAEFQKKMMAEEAAQAMAANPQLKALADKNAAEGAAFFAENGKKEGVQTTPSGLQYKVLTAGQGQSPKASDNVQTHYSGKLLDGTVFDSSYERGQPASFGVDQVIPGWTEALQKMKVGDKWEVYIPGDLAYGPGGRPPKIGPNAALVFTVELIAVEPTLPAPDLK